MPFSLDANTVIALLKGHEKVWTNLESSDPAECFVSAIVIHELYYGAFKSARVKENLERVAALRFPVLEFEEEDARVAGEVRASLSRAGTPIGPLDTLIAGQALARGMVVVTRNSREFARVDGLSHVNWEDA